MRDRSVDFGKGIMVLAMIYCHVLEFFGDSSLYPCETNITWTIGALAFPTFLYFFGRSVSLAYLDKSYTQAIRGMLRTFLRMIVAFYVSGIFNLLFVKGKAFERDTIRQVLVLESIPGVSEFLIAFALYMLLTIVFFPILKVVRKHTTLIIVPLIISIACCFIPYQTVTMSQLALFIGGVDQYYFPVVQYMPYFLFGIVFDGLSKKKRWIVLSASAIVSFVAIYFSHCEWPSRFPPSWNWICLSAFGVALVQVITWGWLGIRYRYISTVTDWVAKRIEHIGAGSLTYLLMSNFFLFAISGKRAVPKPLIFQKHWFWSKAIQSPIGALYWSCILVALIAYCIYIAGRSNGKKRL